MATTTAQIKDLLLPGLKSIFGDYEQIPSTWDQMFTKYDSNMAYERDVEVKLLGLAQLRNEGQATAYEDMGERFVYAYKHVGISLGFVMTKFAIRDNLYKSQFGPNTRALKHSFRQTKEVFAASVFNNASDTSGLYFGGDSQPLLSANHPIDTGTNSNTFTVQAELNETSLQDAMIGVRRFRDAAGLRIMARAKKLMIPPDLMFVAKRLMGTQLRVGTADNDTNALRELNMLDDGIVINDFMTNTRAWFVKTDVPDGLKYYQRDPMETDMHTDMDTDNLKVKGTERFSFGWSNHRAIFGSTP